MGLYSRICKDKLSELDHIVADASNIFNSAAIRFSEGKYKKSAMTVAAFGLMTMQSGLAITMLEIGGDSFAFSDMLKPDYLSQILNGARQFTGEYVMTAGAAIVGVSSPVAMLATKISTSLHNMASDPLTKLYNIIGNNISDEFRARNINQVINAVTYYYTELSKEVPHDKALLSAWSRVEESLVEAKGLDMSVIAGDIISSLSDRVQKHSEKSKDHYIASSYDTLFDLDFDAPKPN